MKKLSELENEQVLLCGELDYCMTVAKVKEVKKYLEGFRDNKLYLTKTVNVVLNAEEMLENAIENKIRDGINPDVTIADLFYDEEIKQIQEILNRCGYEYYQATEEIENDLKELE